MDKERAREYLIKSRFYRFLALIFAFLGVLLFAYSFFESSEGGDVLEILHDPVRIVFLIFPFVPAIVLSYMAQSAEKKLQVFLKDK